MFHAVLPSLFGRRRPILVPASVLADGAADYALVSSVVGWLNRVRDEGCYHADEIAAEAPQAYNADYYYAQVCNGGHWQFAHHSRMDATTIAHAIDGLTAAGLTELAACLTTLRDRRAGSDDEAAFAALDTRFYAAYGTYHARMNAWLRPKVRVVPDASYAARMEILLRRDPSASAGSSTARSIGSRR